MDARRHAAGGRLRVAQARRDARLAAARQPAQHDRQAARPLRAPRRAEELARVDHRGRALGLRGGRRRGAPVHKACGRARGARRRLLRRARAGRRRAGRRARARRGGRRGLSRPPWRRRSARACAWRPPGALARGLLVAGAVPRLRPWLPGRAPGGIRATAVGCAIPRLPVCGLRAVSGVPIAIPLVVALLRGLMRVRVPRIALRAVTVRRPAVSCRARPGGGAGMRVPVHLAAELRRGPGVRRLPLRRRARRMQLAGCGRRPPHCRRGRLRSLQSRLRRRSARRRPAGPRLRLPRLRRRRLLGAPCWQLSGCLRRVRGRPARARRRLLRAPGLPRGVLRRRPCGLRGRLLCGPRLPPGVWLLPAGVLPAALLVLLLRRGLPPGMLLRPLLSLPGLPAGLPRVLWRAWLPAGVLRLPAGALLRARRLPASRLGRQRWRQGVRVRWQRRRRGLVWRQRRRAGPAPALSRLEKAVTSLCATVPQTQAHALQATVTQCLAGPDGQPQQQTAPVCGRGRASQAHLSAGGRSGALALKRWLRLYSEVHPGRGAAGRALPAGVAALRVVVQLLIAAVRSGLRAGPCCLVPQHVWWRVVCRPSCHQLRAAGRRRLPP